MPRFVPAAGLVLAAGLVIAAPPTPDELARDLGSPVYSVRERASKELWKLGAAARPALEAAAKSGDAEVSRRAADILEKFDWGVFPDTPADVLKLIREFRSGEEPKQTRAIDGLLKEKPAE